MNKEMIQLEMYLSEYRDSKTATVSKIYEDLKRYCKTYGQLSKEVKKYEKHLRWLSLETLAKALVERHEAELEDIPINNCSVAFRITSPLSAEILVFQMMQELAHKNKLKKNFAEGDHHNAEAKKDI